MARYRNSYTLYTRNTVDGKTVYYYRTYTPDGKRTAGKSTGCINKTAARSFCENLLKAGKLYDGSSKRFSDFADNFFSPGGVWHTEKRILQKGVKQISESFVLNQQGLLKNHIMPYFAQIKLETINSATIKQFRIHLAEKKLSIKSINIICSCLRSVINAAIENNYILIDPFRTIKQLYEDSHKRDAFTLDEVKKLFNTKWENENAQLFILTAATTGMRRSEIMAIRSETLHKNYIDVKDQFLHGKYEMLKNKYARKVPIPHRLFVLLNSAFITENVFTYNSCFYARYLKKQAKFITDYAERQLCLHSFRHFFNTFLLSENVSPAKVAAVIGHTTGISSMQDLYTSWKPELMPEVYAAQEKLLNILVTL